MAGEKIEGFDTEPGGLSDFDQLEAPTSRPRWDRRQEPDFEKTLPGPVDDRRQNDALVNRRLFSLKRHVEGLQGGLKEVKTQLQTDQLERVAMRTEMAANTAMTKQVLDILTGGKLLVGLVKFLGVMAVPIAAIATAWHVMFGGSPPGK